MVRRQSGGNTSAVKKIMIDNLCRETKNGDTLKEKDASSFVQVQNLCTTANESNMSETQDSNVEIVNSSNSDKNSGSLQSIFSGGNIFYNVGSMMTFPMRKILGLGGVDTNKLADTAKNKINSMLNKNVERRVQEDQTEDSNSKSVATINKGNIESKIVDRLDNLSGGRRRTKKGKGKVKGKGNKKTQTRRNKRSRKRKGVINN